LTKKTSFEKLKPCNTLVALQIGKMIPAYSILIFVISLFGCPPTLDARGRRPPLHATAANQNESKLKFQ